MPTVAEIRSWFEQFTPPALAESWDNVGLLVGDPRGTADRIMTCLTITPATAAEAVRAEAQLVVSHHPLPFKPLPRVTTETTPGRLVWQLARAGISVYSPHTAFDSAVGGINQQLAELLELNHIAPLVPPPPGAPPGGTGRQGSLRREQTLAEFSSFVAQRLGCRRVQQVGATDQRVTRVAVACGSAGSLLPAARAADCHVFLTGETNFHTCLEAEALGVSLVLPGHYATERLGVERLADELAKAWPASTIWAARDERDPLTWVPE
ncbi:MAG: Nif3-like dinuclear metal center hexameric protein [Pirellulales bacterium]